MTLRLRLRGKSISRLNKSDWDKINAALVARKRAQLMEHLEKVQPIVRLARIYRAMNGDYQLEDPENPVRICDVRGLDNPPTFTEFLRVNHFVGYEEVCRG